MEAAFLMVSLTMLWISLELNLPPKKLWISLELNLPPTTRLLLNCQQETHILCYRVLENLRTKALKMLTLIVQEFDHPPSER